MKCSKCGADNVDNGKFCTLCGAKLPDADEIKPEISLDQAASDILNEGEALADTVVDSLNESVSEAEDAVTQAASDMEDAVDNAFEEMKGDTTGSDSSKDTENSYYDNSSYSSSDIYDENQNGKVGFAIASLVCGCLSIICCCFGCCGFPVPVAAIVLGIIAIIKGFDGRGLAIAGIATGGVALLLEIIWTIYASSEGVLEEIIGTIGI